MIYDADRLRAAAAALDRRLLELARLHQILKEKEALGQKIIEKLGRSEHVRQEIERLRETDEQARIGSRTLTVVFSLSPGATWEHKRQLKALKALDAAGRQVTVVSTEADQTYVHALMITVEGMRRELRQARDECLSLAKPKRPPKAERRKARKHKRRRR